MLGGYQVKLALTSGTAVCHGIKVLEQHSVVWLHMIQEIPSLPGIILDLEIFSNVVRVHKIVRHQVLVFDSASVTDTENAVGQGTVKWPPDAVIRGVSVFALVMILVRWQGSLQLDVGIL